MSAVDPLPQTLLTQRTPDFSECFDTHFFCSIFTHIEVIHLVTTLHIASLTCRKWKALVDDKYLWRVIVSSLNIPLPTGLIDYHSTITINRVTSQAHDPLFEEIAVELNFALCDEVYFMSESYVIGYQQTTLYIQSLKNKTDLRSIDFNANIYSMCTFEEMIYCSLDNGSVVGLPVTLSTETSIHVFVDTFENTKPPSAHDSTQVLANDLWLISISKVAIKQWSRQTFYPIITYCVDYQLFNCQIEGNELYFSTKGDLGKETIFSKNLNEKGGYTPIQQFKSGLSHLQFSCDSGFCYSRPKTISQFNLDTEDILASYQVDTTSSLNFPPFQIFQGLAVVAHQHAPDKIDEDNNFIEWITLSNGESAKTHYPHLMHSSKRGSFAFFYDTFLFATNHQKVVKITFPSAFSRPRA